MAVHYRVTKSQDLTYRATATCQGCSRRWETEDPTNLDAAKSHVRSKGHIVSVNVLRNRIYEPNGAL